MTASKDTPEAPGSELLFEASMAGLFETPVLFARLKDSDDLIAELKTAILKRRESHPGLTRSNVGGWHSDAGMLEWAAPASRTLLYKTLELVHAITHLEEHRWEDVTWSAQMWANVSPPGAQNNLHVHPGNLWAAVLYVDDGLGEAPASDAGGELYFEDPRFPMTMMGATAFRMKGKDGKSQNWEWDFQPRRGNLVIFPSWLRHGVRPYRGQGERISIAMNLNPILKEGSGPR